MVRRRALLRAAAVGTTATLAPAVAPGVAAAAGTHPFLLVSVDEFPALRARADRDPWRTWRDAAIALAGTAYQPATQQPKIDRRAQQMAQIAGSASLAYIVDPDAAATHRATILALIRMFGSDIRPYLDGALWEATVAPSNALFHLVIGLDVIHPSLTATERSAAETVLADAAAWYHANRTGYWPTARIGGYGIWAAYRGDTLLIDESVDALQAHFGAYRSADGAYLSGPTYGGYRLGSPGDRDSKAYYVDVLTRIGRHDFYTDPGYVAMMEHYTGYLTTPVLRSTGRVGRGEFTFADSWTENGAVHRSARTWSAWRFGSVAAANAGWSLTGVPASATLPLITAYVLTEQAPPTGGTVPSRVFPGAGAWFYQASASNLALCGALWNPVKGNQIDHQHKDTNALHLTAYGEHVLRNAGYAGFGTAYAGFPYEVISRRAVVNNTVLVDYAATFSDEAPPTQNDHVAPGATLPGAGITESLLGKALDYASGASGNALPNAKHNRNFVFVHPNTTCQGYWIVFDEVRAARPSAPVRVAWHPNSVSEPRMLSSLTEYVSTIDANPCTSNGVTLSVLLATPPTAVTVKSGPLAEMVTKDVRGRYLYCSYSTDGTGAKNIVTVLFPADAHHPKATMTRLTGPGFCGARVDHPAGSTDYAMESRNAVVVSAYGAAWRGLACVFRVTGGAVDHYLVRRGRSFAYNGGGGFTAAADVSVSGRGLGGRIRAVSTTTVTFRQPGLIKVRLNGVPAAVTASGVGWLTVTVPAGSWVFELVVG